MFTPLLLLQFIAVFQVSHAATITIFDGEPASATFIPGPSAAEYTVKPIGTGTNGEVTYLEHEVITAYLSASLPTTAPGSISFVQQPLPSFTREDTIVQGPSFWSVHIEPTADPFNGGRNRTCTTDSTGVISCVDVEWASGADASAVGTLTQTFTGTLRPVYTFVTNNGQLARSVGGEWTVYGTLFVSLATTLGAVITLL